MDVEAQDDGKMAKITVIVPTATSQLQQDTETSWTTAGNWVKGREGRYSDSCIG